MPLLAPLSVSTPLLLSQFFILFGFLPLRLVSPRCLDIRALLPGLLFPGVDSLSSCLFFFSPSLRFEASDKAIDGMHNQYLCNRQISVQYAYKKDTRGERHGGQVHLFAVGFVKFGGAVVAVVTSFLPALAIVIVVWVAVLVVLASDIVCLLCEVFLSATRVPVAYANAGRHSLVPLSPCPWLCYMTHNVRLEKRNARDYVAPLPVLCPSPFRRVQPYPVFFAMVSSLFPAVASTRETLSRNTRTRFVAVPCTLTTSTTTQLACLPVDIKRASFLSMKKPLERVSPHPVV